MTTDERLLLMPNREAESDVGPPRVRFVGYLAKHEVLRATVQRHPGSATFQAAIVQCEKGGCRVWWRIVDIHSLCMLQARERHGAQAACQWVQRRLAVWLRGLEELGFLRPLERGVPNGPALCDLNRTVDWPVANSIALLYLFGRMAHNGPRFGERCGNT
jgi:hypothetical protein